MTKTKLRFTLFDRFFEIFAWREGDAKTQLVKTVYLGNGHTMAVDTKGRVFSTAIGYKSRWLSRDAASCAKYAEGLARLGRLDAEQVAKFKAQKEADEARRILAYNASQALVHMEKAGVKLTPSQSRRLNRIKEKE